MIAFKKYIFPRLISGLFLSASILFPAVPGNLYSQSNVRLTGQVLDSETGFPVAGAAVSVRNTPFGAYSNEEGFFAIENIPPGNYTIEVSMMGYRLKRVANVAIREDSPRKLVIKLQEKVFNAQALEVVAETDRNLVDMEGDKVVISGKELDRYRSLGLPQLLQQVAGVQVEASGSGASRALIRIHGGRSSEVLVLLDGQRLNNPQTGEVDLSQIPLQQVQKIEVIRQGNSAIFGGSAFDGVISFHTGRIPPGSRIQAGALGGSFETAMANLALSSNVSRAGMLLSYRQDYSRQNFSYEYDGQDVTRDNAWYQNRRLFGKLAWQPGRFDGNVLVNYRQGQRGLPCPFFNECLPLNSRMEEKIGTIQLNQRYFFSAGNYIEGLIGFYRLYQHYNNEDDPVVFTRYRTEQTNRNVDVKVQGRFSPWILKEMRVGVHYLNESLDQQNLLFPQHSIGKKVRDSKAGFLSAEIPLTDSGKFWQTALFRSAIRYEKYFDQPWRWYPTLGLSLVPPLIPALTLSGSWYKAVRYPDFNSLFWKGDSRAQGNSQLQPERKQAWNISARFRPPGSYFPALAATYYSENIEDLIYWHRGVNGVWEPRNEELVEKDGLDLELRQPLLPEHLNLQVAYSHVNAINKTNEVNRFNKRIIFIPEHTLNASLWFGVAALQGQVVYRYLSERETVFSNSGGTQLAAYGIWDASLTYLKNSTGADLQLDIAIKNLTGANYQLLFGYPMPGREFQITLSVKLHTL